MKVTIAAFCLLAACYSEENLGFSVVGAPRWAVSLGGRTEDRGMDVAIDSIGDVIVSGDFNGPADFGSGLDTVGGPWGFITKRFASDGAEAWTIKLLGQDASSFAYVSDLAVGPGNTIVAVGEYWGKIDFGGTTLTRPSTNPTAFVARLAPDGTLLGVTELNAYAQPTALALDALGRIYITGDFSNSTLNFNGQLFTERDNDADAFLAAFDPNGTLLWGTAFQGAGAGPYASDVTITATGDVLVTGTFSAPVSFGGPEIWPDAPVRSFVTRFHTDGSYISSQWIGPTSPIKAEWPQLAIDVAGHIVIQQTERDESITGPTPWETMSPATLHVYDDAMNELWTSQLANHGSQSPQQRTLATTPSGLIVSSAWTDEPYNADDPASVGGAMEVAAYDAQGASSIDTFGTRMIAGQYGTMARDAAVSATGAIAFTGDFDGIVDFGSQIFASRGQNFTDIFIVIVDPPAN